VSDLEKALAVRKERVEAKVAAEVSRVRRSLSGRVGRGLAWGAGGLLVLIVLLLAAFAWYSTTPDFDRRVRAEVVKVLEDATGGRVEMKKISFDLWHLAIEASNRRPSLRVLYTSGYSKSAMLVNGFLDAGALLLTKPYRRADLAKMIRTALAM